jgi:hypothetical protein
VGINKDILRWVLLLAAMPIWLPFLRILWRDFNRALQEEGGIFGRTPTARDAERIRLEKMREPEPLVSERWARRGETAAPAARAPARGSTESRGAGGGFRSSGARAPTPALGPRSPTLGSRSPGTSARPSPAPGPPGGFRANPRRDRESGPGFR